MKEDIYKSPIRLRAMQKRSVIAGLLTGIFLVSCLFVNEFASSVTLSLSVFSSGRIGLDWLHTEGSSVVDSEGKTVILRGANFMGYEFGAWGRHAEEDYAKMASWGFNVVRLPIAWHYIEPKPGYFDLTYFENYVDRDIRWARKHGIYIILDMHQYYWSPYFTFWSQTGEKGNGLPFWSVSGYPNTPNGSTQAITDFWLGKGPNGTDATERNPSMKDRFMTMWEMVASRYATDCTIAAFDLFNEPHRGLLSRQEHAGYLYGFYEKLIPEIRKRDANHMLIYEHTATYTNQYAKAVNYTNVVFSFHFYRLRSTYNGSRIGLESLFNEYYKYVSSWSIPILVGEFNTHTDYPNAEQWMCDTIDIFTKHNLSWTWWTYYECDSDNAALCYANGTERSSLLLYLRG